MRCTSSLARGAFLQRRFVVVYDSVVRFWLPPTPLLSIAPLRDCWFAVDALATREGSLQQRGLLIVRIGFSWLKCLSRVACFTVSVIRLHFVWSVGYFATAVRQWSKTPLCGLRHGVIRWFVRHRWMVIDPRVSSLCFMCWAFCTLLLDLFSCHCRTLLPFTCYDDFLSVCPARGRPHAFEFCDT